MRSYVTVTMGEASTAFEVGHGLCSTPEGAVTPRLGSSAGRDNGTSPPLRRYLLKHCLLPGSYSVCLKIFGKTRLPRLNDTKIKNKKKTRIPTLSHRSPSQKDIIVSKAQCVKLLCFLKWLIASFTSLEEYDHGFCYFLCSLKSLIMPTYFLHIL